MNTEVNVVLVRTLYPSNIGSAARAMSNMGADRLILVAPQCEVNSKARQGAAGAQAKLRSHEIYRTWEDFYKSEGRGLRIAFTRREGKKRGLLKLKDGISRYKEQFQGDLSQPIYLIFGPEDNGLDATDLEYTNMSCLLPTYGEFPSMNLAHAVLLALYITQEKLESLGLREPGASPQERPDKQPLNFPDEEIKEWLTAMGFDVQARRASAYITVRRLLLQSLPTETDLEILQAILQQNIRKLKESPLASQKNPATNEQ